MIYTVTLNPALDYHLYTPEIHLGETHRANGAAVTVGGKGINVSVILTRLGIPNTAWGFVGGFTGDELCRRLTEAGVTHRMIRLPQGDTRINVKLHTTRETEINTDGPVPGDEALDALFHKMEALTGDDLLVLSGSIPATIPSDLYGQILERLSQKEIPCVVDAEGMALLSALPYHPFLIKPNLKELSALAGRSLVTKHEILAAARDLHARGAENVLVSLGRDGAILLTKEGQVLDTPALGGRSVNTVGAGDSMVAGFLAGLPMGYAAALRLGAAAGGATACGEGLGERERILALYDEGIQLFS